MLATASTRNGKAKLLLRELGDEGLDRSLVLHLPGPNGREVTLAPECGDSEKGAIIARKSDFLVVAIPSRVPQAYVVSQTGQVKRLETSFAHEDWFWVTQDHGVVFEQMNYQSGPSFLRVRQYQTLDPKTLKFRVVSIEEAKRDKIDSASLSSSKESATNLRNLK